MAQDKIQGNKTSRFYDRDAVPGFRYETATQLGIVMDNLSPARDGRLRIWIPEFGGDQTNPLFWRTVNYASPYLGSTYQPQSSQNNNFEGVMHTYGMWMVTPDIGSQVLCTFVNGDPEKGFWFACIPANLSNWMLPAVGASSANVDKTTVSEAIKASILPDTNVPPQVLPVAEFNENIESNVNSSFFNNKKPIHEFQANILFKQGLDRDSTRGAISSSAQRETPSHVFGISTPGRPLTKDPMDDPEYATKVAAGNVPMDQYSVPTRKGGHSFVMDDGDATGTDQLIRLRTGSGHQILMNDDKKVIYVGHMDGSTWFEINESGVYVYTAGDFSLRTEGTLNLHSDKDINMQAGGAINMVSTTMFNMNSAQVNLGGSESFLIYGSKLNMGGGQVTVSSDGKLNVSAGGALQIAGSTIDINGGSGGNSISMPTLQKNKLADTTFDDQKTKLWYSQPQSVDSIVTILPSHEPYVRTGSPAPLTKSVSSSVCAPKTAGTPGSYTLPAPNGNAKDKGKVNGVPTPWSTDKAFLDKVQQVASAINANYIDLLAAMANETGGTMDPGIVNSIGATGLIQFMPATATGLGTSTTALKSLSRVDQLDWVLKFFQSMRLTAKAPTPKLQDLYLCVYWPAAVGKPDNYVVNPAGSKQAQQNASLRAADGSITCASVGAAAAKWLPDIQQALANAGVQSQAPAAPAGALTDGSGNAVTDSSGNPIKTGQSADSDVGISNASGQEVVQPTCPAEFLAKTTTFNPPGNFGATTPNLSQAQAKAMMAELGYFESQFAYDYKSSDGTRIGKYAVDAQYLADAGYIKPDAIKQYGPVKALTSTAGWTGRDGIQSIDDFSNSPNVQDNIQYQEFSDNYAALVANGGIKPDDDVCTAAGMMFVAHQLRSADTAKQWRTAGEISDSKGQDGAVYYNHGRYAIDILAAGGAAATVAQTAGLSGENTTGINPDDVFVFSGASGTRSNFDQLNGTFKDAILKMAQDFKAKTGSKITITSAYRSPADQDAIYQRWLAAGGGPNNPTAGGITTPAKPLSQGGKGSPHNSGAAIDSSQCPLISRTVDLAQYGLRWGGTFSKPDPVHIQLANAGQ